MSDQTYFIERKYEQTTEMQALHLNVLKTGLDRLLGSGAQSAHDSFSGQQQAASRQSHESTRINDLENNDAEGSDAIDVDFDEPTITLMKTLKIRESEIKAIISVIYKLNDSTSFGYAKTQLKMLKTAWQDYRQVSVQLQVTTTVDDFEKRYQVIQQMYAEAMGTINDIVHSVKGNANIELPKKLNIN